MEELTPRRRQSWLCADQEGGCERIYADQESHHGYSADEDGGNVDQATDLRHADADEESRGIVRNEETRSPQKDRKKGAQESDVRGCCSVSGGGARRRSLGLK
jgi:hypothetical protein